MKKMADKGQMLVINLNKRAGINLRLLSATMAIIAGLALSLGFIGLRITNDFVQKKSSDRIQFLAKYLARNVEVGVLIGDISSLQTHGNNVLKEDDVAAVRIFDRNNELLAEMSRDMDGELYYIEVPVVFKKSVDENVLFEKKNSNSEDISPDAGIIGKVHVYYSNYGVDQLMYRITQKFVYASVSLTIFALAVFYFISRPIVMEVTDLALVARKIAMGNRLLRANPGNIPETRDLSVAFNSMLDSLDRSRDALNFANKKMMHQRVLAEIGKFSFIIAHEFKNPLAIIKSSFDILKKDFFISGDNILSIYIEDEIKRLNRLIEDFLMFARPVEPIFRNVDLNQVISDICDRFGLIYPESQISFDLKISEEPVYAEADQDLLTRCISNILKNACEAASSDGKVSVETFTDSGFWLLKISDDGEGLAACDINKIFDPFFTTKSKGSGLGLSFAAQVIESHRGYIEAGNSDSCGAIFTVRIPIE